MAQARRKSPGKVKAKSGGHLAGIALLLAGMVIGSLATILWQGARTVDGADGGIGAGIRQMLDGAGRPPPAADNPVNNTASDRQAQPARPSTPFDFFTVLPEIEVVAPTIPPPDEAPAVTAETVNAAPKTADATDSTTATKSPPASGSSYMLQAASYQRRAEAERLKATLALNGLVSAIQKVSIQGRGDFYRVRLGPYPTFEAMLQAEQRLTGAGIKALRLKVSKAG